MTPRDRTHKAGPPAALKLVPELSRPASGRRSAKQIDAEIELYAAALCTEAEIIDAADLPAGVFDAINRRRALDKGRNKGLAALRAAQLKLAETSAPMAIFLGRVYLGQSDRGETDPRASNEIAEVAQNVRERLRALVAEANQRRYDPSDDRWDE